MVYHGNVGKCTASYCSRVLFLDPVYYNGTAPDGSNCWPSMGHGGTPSHTEQLAPVVKAAGEAEEVWGARLAAARAGVARALQGGVCRMS